MCVCIYVYVGPFTLLCVGLKPCKIIQGTFKTVVLHISYTVKATFNSKHIGNRANTQKGKMKGERERMRQIVSWPDDEETKTRKLWGFRSAVMSRRQINARASDLISIRIIKNSLFPKHHVHVSVLFQFLSIIS